MSPEKEQTAEEVVDKLLYDTGLVPPLAPKQGPIILAALRANGFTVERMERRGWAYKPAYPHHWHLTAEEPVHHTMRQPVYGTKRWRGSSG